MKDSRAPIDHETLADRTVIYLRGEIDLESSPAVRQRLLDCLRESRDLVVEMSGVSYIDSSGIASLIEAFQTARNGDLNFALCHVGEPAMRVLQLARLDRIFPVLETVDAPFEGQAS